jgi:hypothetical protein
MSDENSPSTENAAALADTPEVKETGSTTSGTRRRPTVEVPISTVVRLMNLTTIQDFQLLQSKLDLALTRQEADHNQLEALSAMINSQSLPGLVERLSVQLSQLQLAIKQIAKKVGAD